MAKKSEEYVYYFLKRIYGAIYPGVPEESFEEKLKF